MSRLGQDSAHHADRAPGIVPDINDPTAGQVALGIVGDAIEGYGCPAMSPVAEAATPEVDPQQVIDQVFDFAEKMLAVQREFAKSRAAVPDRQRKSPASNPNPLWAPFGNRPRTRRRP
jgi:hypothetical protein